MPKVFDTQRRVEFRDTDAAGIAHFSAYLCYMEQAEHEFLRFVGSSVVQPHPAGGHLSWPRVKVECNYVTPARFEEMLSISVQISRLGSKSVTYQFTFKSDQDNLVAQGTVIAVCCHVKDHGASISSIDIPDRIRILLDPYVNSDNY